MAEAPPPKGSSGSVGVEEELIVSLISLVYQQLSTPQPIGQRFLKCFFTYELVISRPACPVSLGNNPLKSFSKRRNFIPGSLPTFPSLNQALCIQLDSLFGVLPESFQNSTNLGRPRPRVILCDSEKISRLPEWIQAGTTCCPRRQLRHQLFLSAQPVRSGFHAPIFPTGCGHCPVPLKFFFQRHGKSGICRKLFSFCHPSASAKINPCNWIAVRPWPEQVLGF